MAMAESAPEPGNLLRAQQLAFADHLRDPQQHAAPEGIDPRRLAVYRELFANNIHSLLSSNFPVIRQTLGDADWLQLTQRFYAEHRCETPLFTQIGGEFIAWLEAHLPSRWPWLAELAHYEWLELALLIDATPLPAHEVHGDLLAGVPLLSPHIAYAAYTWPVHRIGPQFTPVQPPAAPSLLLVRLDADYEVRFSELSPLAYRLLELLQPAEHSGRQVLRTLAQEAGAGDAQDFAAAAEPMLERLRREGTVLGIAV